MDGDAKKLNPKQQAFVAEYLIDLNASAAGVRAGYSASYARRVCSTWVGDFDNCAEKHIHIWHKVQQAKQNRVERTEIDSDYVLKRLVEIDEMDVLDILSDDGGLKPISEWPKTWRQFIGGFEIAELWEGRGDDKEQLGLLKKIKWPDKVKNLELIGKHVAVGAFANRIEISPAEQFADIIKRRKK
ncbi:terminase small subunit [Vibrio mediterranei]|uniref:terminase small subunit n=1 Tax=Vibrio mediterranei TaxID=689 RepID=UPI00184FADCE|nr:terminase small subunit [Vibrio mediterranei]NUW71408.1 terminase small subunit [Vibrio mediterranei]